MVIEYICAGRGENDIGLAVLPLFQGVPSGTSPLKKRISNYRLQYRRKSCIILSIWAKIRLSYPGALLGRK
jgi:hypothetical protein